MEDANPPRVLPPSPDNCGLYIIEPLILVFRNDDVFISELILVFQLSCKPEDASADAFKPEDWRETLCIVLSLLVELAANVWAC